MFGINIDFRDSVMGSGFVINPGAPDYLGGGCSGCSSSC
jgi:Fe-S cluster assembly iron-binding protein IscA